MLAIGKPNGDAILAGANADPKSKQVTNGIKARQKTQHRDTKGFIGLSEIINGGAISDITVKIFVSDITFVKRKRPYNTTKRRLKKTTTHIKQNTKTNGIRNPTTKNEQK